MRLHPVLSWAYPVAVIGWLAAHRVINGFVHRRESSAPAAATRLDTRVPFRTWAVPVYFSGFALANLLYVHPMPEREVAPAAVGLGLLGVSSLVIFVLRPRRAERIEVPDTDSLWSRALVSYQSVSKPYNAFPSMHAGFGVFNAAWLAMSCNGLKGLLFATWFVAVSSSTLFAKQHTVVDVIGGTCLGLSAVGVSLCLVEIRPG